MHQQRRVEKLLHRIKIFLKSVYMHIEMSYNVKSNVMLTCNTVCLYCDKILTWCEKHSNYEHVQSYLIFDENLI